VSGLQYWLKGVPAPGKLARTPKVNAEGLIVELEQNGWIIRYDAYTHYTHPTLKTLSLPQRIQLEHFSNNPNRRTKLKFVLQKWTF
jgi:outer membrane biogenesis lipoprotein LolB